MLSTNLASITTTNFKGHKKNTQQVERGRIPQPYYEGIPNIQIPSTLYSAMYIKQPEQNTFNADEIEDKENVDANKSYSAHDTFRTDELFDEKRDTIDDYYHIYDDNDITPTHEF